MKREGRQHGMVRTSRILPSPWNPKPNSRFIHRFDSPPTAGLFTKVHPRPTNHSKFTGKCSRARCNGCHMHPCCKSKDKTKGTNKVKSHDVVSNYRLISWRVVDGRPGFNFSGFSATGILDHLANEYVDDEVDADDEIDLDCYHDHSSWIYGSSSSPRGMDAELEIQEFDDNGGDDDDNGVDEVEDDMSFCDLGFLLDQVEEDEGWCLVADI